MVTVLRWVLFALSAAGIGATAERIARRTTDRGDLRFVATGGLMAALAVTSTLLLGLVGWGGSAIALALIAVAGAVASRLVVPATAPSSLALAVAAWRRSSVLMHAWLGALAGGVIAETAYLMWRPGIGTDALIYHLTEPAMWVQDGHPGSMHATVVGLPVEAYPKTGEVLFGWAIGTARTPIATTFVMVAALVLLAVAAWSALRRLAVEQWVAVTIAATCVLSPVVLTQVGGPNTDLFTLTWILCTGALCLGALTETGLLAVALVCGGLAVGTRTTAVPFVVVVLAVTFWVRRRAVLEHVVGITLASAVTIGIGLVWYIQDLAVYHAPLYPFSSFPAGPPVPAVISALDATFLHDPAAAVRVAHLSGYAHALGGGLVLAAGVVAVVAMLPIARREAPARLILLAAAAAAAEVLIWSAAPFTGASGGPGERVLVLGGVRYLLPGLALFALTVGLATRARGLLGGFAKAVALAALGVDVWADVHLQLGERPRLAILVAVAVAVAVLAAILPVARHGIALTPRLAAITLSVAGTIGVVAAGSAATHGYLARHIAVARRLHIDAPDLLAGLDQQPGWHDGHLPVATGPVADALLAGPTFDHPLQVIPQTWSCRRVQAAARAGWVILSTKPTPPQVAGAAPYDRVKCLAGRPPLFEADGLSVYAPAP